MRTYRDLLLKPSRIEIYPKILVWTANYETCVFSIDMPIHPQAKWVWCNIMPYRTPSSVCYMGAYIQKYERIGDQWELVEESKGKVCFVNNNPFDSQKNNAASNTAEC